MISEAVLWDEGFIKKGRMKKSPLLMDEEEYRVWEQQETVYIRNYLFSIGQPLVHLKDGVMVAEFEDGRIQKI